MKHVTRESLSQFIPQPPNHNVVLVISGHKRCTGSKFGGIRNWTYGLIEKHAAAGGKVVINCFGSTDPLHRISSWPGFAVSTNVVAKSQPLQLIANFDASTFVFEQVAEHQIVPEAKSLCEQAPKHVLFEIGDHADDHIAAASAVRAKRIPVEEVYDDCGDDITVIELPNDPPAMFCTPNSEHEFDAVPIHVFDSTFLAWYMFGSSYEEHCTNR